MSFPFHGDFSMDKSEWGDGPWQHEPDRLEWRDEATGLPCLIVRGTVGQLCGYVGVVKGHPYYDSDYAAHLDIEVHGYLTYSNKCQGVICHTPAPGDSGDVWWFGFDCGHFMDLNPASEAFARSRGWPPIPGEIYRDLAYVKSEVAQLARQLHDANA